ncbi:MAG: thioredoxin domain-containing protein [Rikenellaceae bacterium]
MKKLLFVIVCLTMTVTFANAQSNYKSITSVAQFEKLLDGSDDEDRLLVGDRGIVLDFTATWCNPCKSFAPIFKSVASRFVGKVDFYTVDYDKNPEMVELFEVEVVPTLVFIPVCGDPTIIKGAIQDADEFAEAVRDLTL